MNPARLAFPALRWREDSGFDHESAHIDSALELGVGGFIVFGGEAAAVQNAISELRRRSRHPLLIGADLERGAGQQFAGCTSLPPAAALGSLDDPQTVYQAGRLTAREARLLGVTWIFAPVADLSNEPLNPIVGTRAFAGDPEVAARCTTAWVMGCLEGGALPCVKHFPGHGRTRSDSHVELPVVETGFDDLSRDLLPFATAIRAGTPSVMTAHVAYPILDPSGSPATRSRPIVSDLLRGELGFEGLVVSDAMIMEGALAGVAEEEAAVAAVCAGVDVVLYPNDPGQVAGALARALDDGRLTEVRALEAERRIVEMTERVGEHTGEGSTDEDRRWAEEVAVRCVRLPGDWTPVAPGRPLDLLLLDDDLGGPHPPPSRQPLVTALERRGLDVRLVESPAEPRRGPLWVALFADTRGWKGRAGLSEKALSLLSRVEGEADLLLLFGDPRLRGEIDRRLPLVDGWGGEAVMQEAVAVALVEIPGS